MNYKDQLIEEQDRNLDEIIDIAERVKKHTQNIGSQLNKQKGLIGELDTEVDKTNKKMGFVQKKLGDLLNTNDPGQICTILSLFAILLVLIALVIYT